MIDTRSVDLRRLNSATKYPSILTYHGLGEKGSLLDTRNVDFDGLTPVVTEKVDGTNSRIILMPDDVWLIGSREELLHASGDLIHNPAMGIVDALRETAGRLAKGIGAEPDVVTTVYVETYGGKTTAAAKQYTGCRTVGFRLFDVSRTPVTRLDDEVEQLSVWREAGGQQFLNEEELTRFAEQAGVELTPRIELQEELPSGIDETYEWLKGHLSVTGVALDDEAKGRPEGVVVRTSDRSRIAKIRFDDYARHQRRKSKQRR